MDKILIVDDDFLTVQQLKDELETSDRKVSYVTKAKLALLRLNKEQFDLILLDVKMPEFSGVELLKEIRLLSNYKDVPVIMITGNNETSVFVDCFNSGANDYIEKPINSIVLLTRVNALLSYRKQFTENLEKSEQLNKAKIQIERNDTIQYKLRSLVARMNPHFIFNTLNSIQYHVLEDEKDLALEGISGFSKLIRASLNQSEKNLIFLDEEVIFLENYLQLEQNRLGDKLSYKINISDKLLDDDIMLPPMIIQPFIENSIIHGITNLASKGKIAVDFSLTEKYLIINIIDNGVGRKKAIILKQQRKGQAYSSKAQSIIDLRMLMFSEFYNKTFSYKIEDLFDDNNNQGGTKIIVKIPIDLYE